jgi:hypothetical protein
MLLRIAAHLRRPSPARQATAVTIGAAADILMIAVGTGLVVDAIEDLGRL